MENHDRAFGWPAGSVRALLAIMLVVAVAAPAAFLTVYLAMAGNTEAALTTLSILTGLGGAAVGYYFGSNGSGG